MAGFVNGSGHDFLSNQVIGGFGAGQDGASIGASEDPEAEKKEDGSEGDGAGAGG